jgi:hypothetical protein
MKLGLLLVVDMCVLIGHDDSKNYCVQKEYQTGDDSSISSNKENPKGVS